MNKQQRRAARKMALGTKIEVAGYAFDAEGKSGLYWFVIPDGMTREEAFDTQEHYGPFATEAEAVDSQRLVLFGEQCQVTEGGMWDPAWDRLQ